MRSWKASSWLQTNSKRLASSSSLLFLSFRLLSSSLWGDDFSVFMQEMTVFNTALVISLQIIFILVDYKYILMQNAFRCCYCATHSIVSVTHLILLLKWWQLVQFYHGDDCAYGLFRNATATIQVFSVSLSLKVRCLWLTFFPNKLGSRSKKSNAHVFPDRCMSWRWRRRKRTHSPTRCFHPPWQGWITIF